MRKKMLATVALAGLIALTACGESVLTSTTSDLDEDTPTTGVTQDTEDPVDDSDIAETVAEVQAQVAALTAEIESSAMAAELEESWNELQGDVTAALANAGDEGMIDPSSVESAIDDFQADLDALGDEVEPTLVEAWNTLKNQIQGLMS